LSDLCEWDASDTDFRLDEIASAIYRKFGIKVGKDTYERLKFRLGDMIRRGCCADSEELCSRLSAGDEQCYEALAGFVTTSHTFFFRDPEQFAVLVSDIRRNENGRVRIWCAACSTGEEAYSIAMTLLDAGITGFHITATDVNRNVLAAFNRGVYHENRFFRTDDAVRRRYFVPEEDGYWSIDRRLRDFVSIKEVNLMDSVRFPGLFDYVFCRNVFIYFDEKSRKRALENITANLRKDGLLFIGQSEVLLFEPAKLSRTGCSTYRRKD